MLARAARTFRDGKIAVIEEFASERIEIEPEPKGAAMQTHPSHSPSEKVEGGSVVGLWRYPVKSMMGEELNAAEVTERGLVGDRHFALVDGSTGKIAGAKNPTVTDFDLPAGTFFDLAVVHLLTTATIDHLRALYPEGRFEIRRFRPNIVVSTDPAAHGFVENNWIGHTIAIGDKVRLRITGLCPRCVMTTLPQGDLPKDVGILRAAAQHNHANVGVYPHVIAGRVMRRGDPVALA